MRLLERAQRGLIQNRLAAAVNGRVHVGRISGNPFSGITIDSLSIWDRKGELFFSTGKVAADYDVRDLMDGAALLASTANVVMQLAQPPVGYGVLESKVASGQVMRHPVRRIRTTRSDRSL